MISNFLIALDDGLAIAKILSVTLKCNKMNYINTELDLLNTQHFFSR